MRLDPEKLREAAWRGFRRYLLDSMPRRLSYILGEDRAARLVIEASEKATMEGLREMLEGLGVDASSMTARDIAAMVSMGLNSVMQGEVFSTNVEEEGDGVYTVKCLDREVCSLLPAGIGFFLGMYSGALRLLGHRAAAIPRRPGQEDKGRLCRSVMKPEFIVWFDREECRLVIEELRC